MLARTAARRARSVAMRPTGVSAVSAGQALPSVSAARSETVNEFVEGGTVALGLSS